jgi:hypothetical protein
MSEHNVYLSQKYLGTLSDHRWAETIIARATPGKTAWIGPRLWIASGYEGDKSMIVIGTFENNVAVNNIECDLTAEALAEQREAVDVLIVSSSNIGLAP